MSAPIVYWNIDTVSIPFNKTVKQNKESFVYHALRVDASEYGQQVAHLFAVQDFLVKLNLKTKLDWETLEIFFKSASPFPIAYYRHQRDESTENHGIYQFNLMGSEADSTVQKEVGGVTTFSIRLALAAEASSKNESLTNRYIYLDPQIVVSEGTGGSGGSGGGGGSGA